MASFAEELWNSIFTPGTTPTLLLATNATFASLQVVLLSLLAATRSIHFVILSMLCAGLWGAVNWFAAELQREQAKEAEARAKAETIARQTADDSEDSGDEETETEVGPGRETGQGERGPDTRLGGNDRERKLKTQAQPRYDEDTQEEDAQFQRSEKKSTPVPPSTVISRQVEAVEPVGELIQRSEKALSGTVSSVSTEDEWEKVSENEKEKDK